MSIGFISNCEGYVRCMRHQQGSDSGTELAALCAPKMHGCTVRTGKWARDMEKSIMKSVAERGCISWETTPLKMYILLVILTDYPDDFLCPQTRSTLQQSDGNTLTPAYHLLAIEASSPEEEKGKKELAAPPAKEEKPAAPPSSRLPVFPNGNRIASLLGRPKSTSATAAPALPAPGTGRPSTRSTPSAAPQRTLRSMR